MRQRAFFNSWIVIKLTRFPGLNTAIRRVSVRGASHIRQKLCFCSGEQPSEKPPILANKQAVMVFGEDLVKKRESEAVNLKNGYRQYGKIKELSEKG